MTTDSNNNSSGTNKAVMRLAWAAALLVALLGAAWAVHRVVAVLHLLADPAALHRADLP